MTVAELIERLKQFDPALPVVVRGSDYYFEKVTEVDRIKRCYISGTGPAEPVIALEGYR